MPVGSFLIYRASRPLHLDSVLFILTPYLLGLAYWQWDPHLYPPQDSSYIVGGLRLV